MWAKTRGSKKDRNRDRGREREREKEMTGITKLIVLLDVLAMT